MSYNQYKGVIHKHLVKDDPCWENYEMVGTKVQDGKEVPNCVPKQQKDDEPVEKRRWPRLGRIIMTRGVADKMNPEYWGNTPAGKNRANKFKRDVQRAMAQYKRGDWGMSGREDSKLNDASVEEGSRILAVYNTVEGKIWIITERGHSRTTILFPSEY